jgi:hypothetical protein
MEGRMSLPPLASAKLSSLSALADDASVLVSGALAQIKAADTRLEAVLHEINTTTGKSRIDQLRSEASVLTNEIERLRGVRSERQARRDQAAQLVTRLRGWIEKLPAHAAFAMAPPVPLETGVGGLRAAVEGCREKIKELRAEMDTVRKAPLTNPEVRHFVTAWVRDHAERGRPVIEVDHDRANVAFTNARALVAGDRLVAQAPTDFFIWLMRDQVAEALLREADSLSLKGAMTREDRAARLEQLRIQLLAAERAEEAAIMAAAEQGTVVLRRADADPLAVLGIQVVGAAAATRAA